MRLNKAIHRQTVHIMYAHWCKYVTIYSPVRPTLCKTTHRLFFLPTDQVSAGETHHHTTYTNSSMKQKPHADMGYRQTDRRTSCWQQHTPQRITSLNRCQQTDWLNRCQPTQPTIALKVQCYDEELTTSPQTQKRMLQRNVVLTGNVLPSSSCPQNVSKTRLIFFRIDLALNFFVFLYYFSGFVLSSRISLTPNYDFKFIFASLH